MKRKSKLTVVKRAKPATQAKKRKYDTIKEAARSRTASLSLAGRDIGEIPACAHPRRRAAALKSLKKWCETYAAATFYLPWADDHLKAIKKIERAVIRGGLFAFAMPRGDGKSSLCKEAATWAVFRGSRRFPMIIGPEGGAGVELLADIKLNIETNDKLAEDFPEICLPIGALDGIAQRANGQLYHGKRTHIVWKADEIVLPAIPNSVAAGAIIRATGLTGRVRGQARRGLDGGTLRPDFAIIDDPQTDESARSESQNETRTRIVSRAILKLGGPDVKMAGIMPCTVIFKNDMADRILDKKRYPHWQGERMKMLYAFPTNDALWARYESIYREDAEQEKTRTRANTFYKQHRKAMDAGAIVSWKHRKLPDDVSALQHAMNFKIDDEGAFYSEGQNEPFIETGEGAMLTAPEIAKRLNRHKRRALPLGTAHLTAFIDIQQKALFYAVIAWESEFTGAIVDYGTYPDQARAYFTLRDIKTKTLAHAARGAGLEGAIYAGLEKLADQLVLRQWRRDDGVRIHLERILIDANWGKSTDVVYRFCRQSQQAAILIPSHGRYVGAAGKPMSEYKKTRGDLIGHNWRIPSTKGKRIVRHVIFDANYWKSFIHARLASAIGDKGSLTLFGTKPARHRLFADQLTAEYPTRTQGRGREVDEWKIKPSKPDNHFLDCVVGAAVAASMLGVATPNQSPGSAKRKRKRVSFAQMQREKRKTS